MDDALRQAAVQAISNVFETMFFVFLEPGDLGSAGLDPGTAGAEWLRCTIGFQGRIAGHLRLWIPYSLACELATNFLGLETEASEAQAVDMVKELANMVCGNLFSIFDNQQVYILDMPAAELAALKTEPGAAGLPPGLRLDFLAEDRWIRLEIEPRPAPAGPNN